MGVFSTFFFIFTHFARVKLNIFERFFVDCQKSLFLGLSFDCPVGTFFLAEFFSSRNPKSTPPPKYDPLGIFSNPKSRFVVLFIGVGVLWCPISLHTCANTSLSVPSPAKIVLSVPKFCGLQCAHTLASAYDGGPTK